MNQISSCPAIEGVPEKLEYGTLLGEAAGACETGPLPEHHAAQLSDGQCSHREEKVLCPTPGHAQEEGEHRRHTDSRHKCDPKSVVLHDVRRV